MAGLGMLIVYAVLAIVGPELAPMGPDQIDATNTLAPPSGTHPFGTDSYGHDIFSRTLVGARQSLKVATLSVGFALFVGTPIGLVASYYQGKTDSVIMRSVDVMLAFPSILLALIVIAILGPGLNKAILALGIAYTPIMVRITRASGLSVRQEEYVLAAIAYGESNRGVMFNDMLPNLLSSVIVQATITFAFSILAEAGLSYLGLSAQPPTVTWGVMISEAQSVIEIAPWASLFPGIAITFTVLGLTFFGVGLRDALDPKGKDTIGSDMT